MIEWRIEGRRATDSSNLEQLRKIIFLGKQQARENSFRIHLSW